MNRVLTRMVALGCGLLAGCGGGAPDDGAAPGAAAFSDRATAAPIGSKPDAFAGPLYGQHLPHGRAAVDYLLGEDGTWRDQSGIYYGWNYYQHCATPNHLHDREALLRESAAANSTAPDANCILFGDANNNGEILDDVLNGYAFHEHAGRGLGGELKERPFYQFWFDDNWLARYVTEAYDQPPPSGLHDFGYSIRWRVLGGDNSHWKPYAPSPHVDKIALNGLFKANAGDFNGALADWKTIRSSSGASYDPAERRYEYLFARESIYHLGLWAILSERLLAARSDFVDRNEVLQHAASLHSALLGLQETDAQGNQLGWRTGTIPRALINTETTAIAVLALAANASWVLEPGYPPLRSDAGHYIRNRHGGLSAVSGQSIPGYLVLGPQWLLPPGTYDVDFTLRTGAASVDAAVATLDVHDGLQALATGVIDQRSALSRDQWRRYRLTAEIGEARRPIEFRIFWHGYYDLDVGPVRVTQRFESQ